MNIFYLLIGVSLFAALIFLGAFIWAVRNGQFDDNETPSIRILFDDEPTVNKETETKKEQTK
ncbi:MAG: cbb3-type cytochrome oxidase assembly protein CcoS [Draconibacterium sp.]|nr:cbb3-type cytochrome oxidase assembly protein CcoS [Draconibacterium sp.]